MDPYEGLRQGTQTCKVCGEVFEDFDARLAHQRDFVTYSGVDGGIPWEVTFAPCNKLPVEIPDGAFERIAKNMPGVKVPDDVFERIMNRMMGMI